MNCFIESHVLNFLTGIQFVRSRRDIVGFLISYLIGGMLIFVPYLPFLFTFLNLDPSFVIARELFYPSPIYWTTYHIVPLYIVSLVANFAAFFIFFKYFFGICVISLVTISQITNYALTLNKLRTSPELTIAKFFLSVRMYVIITHEPMSEFLFCLILFSQLTLPLLAWIPINCYDFLPEFGRVGSIVGFIGWLHVMFTLMEIIVHARTHSEELVLSKRRKFHIRNRHRKDYYFTVWWRAQKAFRINCGSRFAMSKSAISNYLRVLSDNIANAVLLIYP